jgi:cytochrome c1
MRTVTALLALLLAAALSAAALAEEGVKQPEAQTWSWNGPFGKFDRTQLQRGYLVYKEVCSVCHAMRLLAFRNLGDPGGPEFSPAQVKAIAAGFQFPTLDDKGEGAQRAGTPADRFPAPFANEKAARAANNNALPPDLSVIVKARKGGEDYLFALLTGYVDPPPAEIAATMNPGSSYNPYFPTHQIAMPPPLTSDGQVTYAPGNPPATKQQMARDVVAFLTWASEPKLEERKNLGVKVIVFLITLAVLLFFAYKRVWRDVEH